MGMMDTTAGHSSGSWLQEHYPAEKMNRVQCAFARLMVLVTYSFAPLH